MKPTVLTEEPFGARASVRPSRVPAYPRSFIRAPLGQGIRRMSRSHVAVTCQGLLIMPQERS